MSYDNDALKSIAQQVFQTRQPEQHGTDQRSGFDIPALIGKLGAAVENERAAESDTHSWLRDQIGDFFKGSAPTWTYDTTSGQIGRRGETVH